MWYEENATDIFFNRFSAQLSVNDRPLLAARRRLRALNAVSTLDGVIKLTIIVIIWNYRTLAVRLTDHVTRGGTIKQHGQGIAMQTVRKLNRICLKRLSYAISGDYRLLIHVQNRSRPARIVWFKKNVQAKCHKIQSWKDIKGVRANQNTELNQIIIFMRRSGILFYYL